MNPTIERALSALRVLSAKLDSSASSEAFGEAQAAIKALDEYSAEQATFQPYRDVAKATYEREGTLEIDDGAPVSLSEQDGGAYVQMWRWIGNDELKAPRELAPVEEAPPAGLLLPGQWTLMPLEPSWHLMPEKKNE